VPADLNGDGVLDILLADGEGYLYAYSTGSKNLETQWAGLGGGPTRSGLSLRVQRNPGPASSEKILLEEFSYVYPNPVRDSRAHVVYRLGTGDVDRVNIDIFTTSGEIVARLEGSTAAAEGLANEVVWEAEKQASGVYVLLIKAHSRTRGEAKIIRKIAVIK
jgi:hypothetical protein